MAEVTNELIYGTPKNLQQRTGNLELVAIERSKELQGSRGHQNSIGTDLNNIHGVPSRIDGRLDRIERRLKLRELAEASTPYRPE